MNRGPIVVVGAGSHARVVIELLRAAGWEPAGVVDPSPSQSAIFGVPVLGGDDVLPQLRAEGFMAICVALGDNTLRQKIGRELRDLGFEQPAAIHPTAFVSPSARIGPGAVVMARAVIGTDAYVADWAIINTNAVVEHDNRIGEAAHIAPGCALAGNVHVGALALVGVGGAVLPGITIGERAIVGAGSAVVRDVAPGMVVAGAPARAIRSGLR
jgi:UDP-perosamine 4-acetyltransferase